MAYEVVGLLGRGATAVVELALDSEGRAVAIKRCALTGSARQIDQARRRLRREAELLRSLDHPALVPVLDVVDDGSDVVLVLPALAENLEDRVARLGHLAPDELARVGRRLLDGLAAAHRGGVVHRDVKPANVLFDAEGLPALADFGVATSSGLTAGLTGVGAVVGTPTWMPPEQARGEPAGAAGDVFGLAATLVWAGTGETPYERGPATAVMARAAAGEVQAVPGSLPEPLRSTLASMLQPDPACRPSAARVLGGFEGTAVGYLPAGLAPELPAGVPPSREPPVGAAPRREPPAGPVPPGRPAGRPRRRWAAAGAAVALVGAACAAGALVIPLGRPGRPGRAQRRAGTPGASVPACTPEPYLPCGTRVPAPHTDGWACDPGWYNLDGREADGCEAHADFVPGTVLTSTVPVRANLVPLSARDSFPVRVHGSAWDLCWGALEVTLTAPARTAEAVTLRRGSTVLARAVSVDGAPATATVDKPSCFGADPERLQAMVTVVAASGDASARDFTLTRNGGW